VRLVNEQFPELSEGEIMNPSPRGIANELSEAIAKAKKNDDYLYITVGDAERLLTAIAPDGERLKAWWDAASPYATPEALREALRRSEKYLWLLHNGGLLNEWAREWNPQKHEPLIPYLERRIDEALIRSDGSWRAS
jgi:uncharacterized protein YigE (DUF2233 family)